MTSIPPPPDLSNHDFDWLSAEGLEKIADIVAPSLPFVPAPWQLQCSARLLNGQDVFCLSATGDGKSALIYIPALARPGTITLVVSPTNYLESDMVCSALFSPLMTSLSLRTGSQHEEERLVSHCYQLRHAGCR